MSLTLQESANLVGGHCWIERRLFERLGAWSQQAGVPAAKLLLDRHAQHAVWRAQQWWDRLPVLAQVEREQLVAAPAGWGPVLSDLGESDADEIRLAIAYRVLLPRLSSRYARHAEQAAPAPDGPAIRALGHVATDVRADWAEGERLVEGLLTDRAALDAAATAVSATEAHFLD